MQGTAEPQKEPGVMTTGSHLRPFSSRSQLPLLALGKGMRRGFSEKQPDVDVTRGKGERLTRVTEAEVTMRSLCALGHEVQVGEKGKGLG